jgi:hypothetical protein
MSLKGTGVAMALLTPAKPARMAEKSAVLKKTEYG